MAKQHDWAAIRADYENGEVVNDLARKYGIARTQIYRRIRKEQWDGSALSARVAARARAKADGFDVLDPEVRDQRVEDAATRLSLLLKKHRDAWETVQEEIVEARKNDDFNRLRTLKISCEALRISQDAERRAWFLTDDPTKKSNGSQQNVSVSIDFTQRPMEDLVQLTRAAFGRESRAMAIQARQESEEHEEEMED